MQNLRDDDDDEQNDYEAPAAPPPVGKHFSRCLRCNHYQRIHWDYEGEAPWGVCPVCKYAEKL